MENTERETSAETTRIVAAQARLFHAERLACPSELSEREAEALARTAIEATAPFPEEQLAFTKIRGSGHVLALGALRSRLDATLPGDRDTAAHVVPDAALPLPLPPREGWRWIATESGLTALLFGPDSRAPLALRGFAIPPDADDATLAALRARHEPGLAGAAHAPGILRFTHATRAPKGDALILHWREIGPADAAPLTALATAAQLDAADLRPAAAVARLREEASTDRRLRLARRALAAFASILLLLQAVSWSLAGVAAWREARLEAGREAADGVEARIALADTLDRVTSRRLPALEWLAAMNAPRPADITLSRAAFADAAVRATGRAGSMGSLNAWLAALRADKAFARVEAPVLRATGEQVNFELILTPRARATGR